MKIIKFGRVSRRRRVGVRDGAREEDEEEAAGADYIVDSPIWVEDAEKIDPSMPPELGEHTEEVLRAIGYDDAGLSELRDAGAIP